MPNELDLVTSWTFFNEVDTPAELYESLMPGEKVFASYRTRRDVASFTNLRLIVRDLQGITGKKVEQYSVPWSSVNMWSTENAGHVDINSEVELWTRAGHIKIELHRDADVRAIDNLIATFVLCGKDAALEKPLPAPKPQPTQPSTLFSGGMFGNNNPFKK